MDVNYIREINAFYNELEIKPLSSSAIALWHALLHLNNRCGWKDSFSVPVGTLSLKSGLSNRSVLNARNELKTKGYLIFQSRDGNKSAIYQLTRLSAKFAYNLSDNVSDNLSDNVSDSTSDNLSALYKHKHKLNETKQDNIPYGEIVDYLNRKTGSSYKPTTKATQSHIKARWREGFRLDDFKVVIDNMVEKWGNDPKMSQYLRPETLFGTKFESYLNAKRRAQVSTTSRLPLVTLTPEEAAEMERIANAQRRA